MDKSGAVNTPLKGVLTLDLEGGGSFPPPFPLPPISIAKAMLIATHSFQKRKSSESFQVLEIFRRNYFDHLTPNPQFDHHIRSACGSIWKSKRTVL